jgi:hypothetical protein
MPVAHCGGPVDRIHLGMRERAVDVFGPEVPLEVEHGALRFPSSPTPIFIDPLVNLGGWERSGSSGIVVPIGISGVRPHAGTRVGRR